MPLPAAILDVDGTLVDTNYHHAIAWYRAFRRHGIVLPVWRIHRHMGMGGDQVIAALCGDETEGRLGDDIREAEKGLYGELIGEVAPLPAARRLIEVLKERGHTVVLASSAKSEELDHYLDLLEAREIVDGWTTSAEVERTKPHPDLVAAGLEKAGGGPGVMVGDSAWDFEAAKRCGLRTIGLLTGGVSAPELREAGAEVVFESNEALIEDLDSTPLASGAARAPA
ncbi:MAG TPA: HAD family hydrolase [Solirubrobacterales bacterium]|nr:HAD family hydrolase [Solirubrobacterales bacterium]